jgi:serine O-acetyltransferase
VPDRGVVVGIPAKLISDQGSEGYINRMAPEALLAACADAYPGRRREKVRPAVGEALQA